MVHFISSRLVLDFFLKSWLCKLEKLFNIFLGNFFPPGSWSGLRIWMASGDPIESGFNLDPIRIQMCMLSQDRNDFPFDIGYSFSWAKSKWISVYAHCSGLVKYWRFFPVKRTLSQRTMNYCSDWVNAEWILAKTESTQNEISSLAREEVFATENRRTVLLIHRVGLYRISPTTTLRRIGSELLMHPASLRSRSLSYFLQYVQLAILSS